jgi:hypothetical protein
MGEEEKVARKGGLRSRKGRSVARGLATVNLRYTLKHLAGLGSSKSQSTTPGAAYMYSIPDPVSGRHSSAKGDCEYYDTHATCLISFSRAPLGTPTPCEVH